MSTPSMPRWKLIGAGVVVVSLVAATPTAAFADDPATTLTVTKSTDDGSEGTLRWAIETANLTAAAETIVVESTAGIIKLDSLLPSIVGPAVVRGVTAPDGTPVVGVDMSNFIDVTVPTPTNSSVNDCPGVTSGYGPDVRSLSNPALAVVDSGDVEISGLVIQNVCIGILGLRSHDLNLHHNTLINSVGAAGIILTGDAEDQSGSATDLSYGHTVEANMFINHGDGAEFTRGTRDSVFRDNTFVVEADAPAGVKGAAAVEYATAGTGNDMIGNTVLGGYGTGLQLGSSGAVFEGNTITGVNNAITLGGSGANSFIGNTITGNNGTGLRVNAYSTISQNSIYDNGGLGIDIPSNGTPNPNDDLDTDSVQNHPVLESARAAGDGVRVVGTLHSDAHQSFVVELFASEDADPSGYGEGQTYLTSVDVSTDGDGNAAIDVTVPKSTVSAFASAVFTATATNASGYTSEFGPAVELPANSGIPIEATVPEEEPGSLTMTVADFGDGVELTQADNVGNLLRFEGALPQVTVTDSRNTTQAGDGGWALSGQSGDFSTGTDTVGAENLGWTPSLAAARAGVAAGAAVAPALSGGVGLAESKPLATANAEGRFGSTTVGADLRLEVPVDTAPGTYAGVLTVTLFPVD